MGHKLGCCASVWHQHVPDWCVATLTVTVSCNFSETERENSWARLSVKKCGEREEKRQHVFSSSSPAGCVVCRESFWTICWQGTDSRKHMNSKRRYFSYIVIAKESTSWFWLEEHQHKRKNGWKLFPAAVWTKLHRTKKVAGVFFSELNLFLVWHKKSTIKKEMLYRCSALYVNTREQLLGRLWEGWDAFNLLLITVLKKSCDCQQEFRQKTRK